MSLSSKTSAKTNWLAARSSRYCSEPLRFPLPNRLTIACNLCLVISSRPPVLNCCRNPSAGLPAAFKVTASNDGSPLLASKKCSRNSKRLDCPGMSGGCGYRDPLAAGTDGEAGEGGGGPVDLGEGGLGNRTGRAVRAPETIKHTRRRFRV